MGGFEPLGLAGLLLVVEVGEGALGEGTPVLLAQVVSRQDAIWVGAGIHAQRGDFWEALRPLGWVEPILAQAVQAMRGTGYCAGSFMQGDSSYS